MAPTVLFRFKEKHLKPKKCLWLLRSGIVCQHPGATVYVSSVRERLASCSKAVPNSDKNNYRLKIDIYENEKSEIGKGRGITSRITTYG